MTIAGVSRTITSASKYGLPPTLRTAQAAMQLPEVQDMLRRLSAFQLGIFMPHQHDEATGEFLPLPAHRHRLGASRLHGRLARQAGAALHGL